jgi:peptidoglycan/xylan/chitin deacetylase (PgdA/CDA1 family)
LPAAVSIGDRLTTSDRYRRQAAKLARRAAQWSWVWLLKTSGALWWAKRDLRRSGAVVVLTLHRVLRDRRSTASQRGIVVSEDSFRRLAEHLARACEPVDLSDARPGTPAKKIKVALTFDDGWEDNYSVALPIARAHRLPLTIFVCPGLFDRERPFWPERVAALVRPLDPAITADQIDRLIDGLKTQTPDNRDLTLRRLAESAGDNDGESTADRTFGWHQAAEMRLEGVRFGSHTHTHQIVTSITAAALRDELRQSKREIERRLRIRCEMLAYPNGNRSREAARIASEEGFRFAFTTERGAWTGSTDLMAIPRSNTSEDNLVGLRGRFSAAMFEYTTFWKAWRAAKRAAAAPAAVSV